jgi:hypothetical protein
MIVSDIPEVPRRSLLLTSKIMQNAVNGVEFKEPYMLNMNSFVHNNLASLKQFMEALAVS